MTSDELLTPMGDGVVRLAMALAATGVLVGLSVAAWPGLPLTVLAALALTGGAFALFLSFGGPRRNAKVRHADDLVILRTACADLWRTTDAVQAGDLICQYMAKLTGGRHVQLYVQGDGSVRVVGGYGTSFGPDLQLGIVHKILGSLRTGAFQHGEPFLVPVSSGSTTIAMVAISGSTRPVDATLEATLVLFGHLAGPAFDRLGGALSEADALHLHRALSEDERHHAPTFVTRLDRGDGLIVFELGADELRRRDGNPAVDLAVGRLGLHLRTSTRPPHDLVARSGDTQFVVILREPRAPLGVVAERLVEAWSRAGGVPLAAGTAIHLNGATPLETLSQAESVLRQNMRDTESPAWLPWGGHTAGR